MPLRPCLEFVRCSPSKNFAAFEDRRAKTSDTGCYRVRLAKFLLGQGDDASNRRAYRINYHHSGGRIVGPMSLGVGRPGAGGCGSPQGGSKLPQSVRARIWSTVAGATKLLFPRICHPPPSARNTAVRPSGTLANAPA